MLSYTRLLILGLVLGVFMAGASAIADEVEVEHYKSLGSTAIIAGCEISARYVTNSTSVQAYGITPSGAGAFSTRQLILGNSWIKVWLFSAVKTCLNVVWVKHKVNGAWHSCYGSTWIDYPNERFWNCYVIAFLPE